MIPFIAKLQDQMMAIYLIVNYFGRQFRFESNTSAKSFSRSVATDTVYSASLLVVRRTRFFAPVSKQLCRLQALGVDDA
jgi:hypothetical protein